MVKLLLTGGCGFIGHHFAEYIFKNTDWDIIIFDKLTYSSMGLDRLKNNKLFYSERVKIFVLDLCDNISDEIQKNVGNDIDYVIHMAAETHVDNSIKSPKYVIKNNIESTITLLEWCRKLTNLKSFFYFSSDEVFGNAFDNTLFKECDRHNPCNPYSASKSASENICLSYNNTYKIPIIIVNSVNVFGERQHVEKYIPLCIKKILNNEIIKIHSYPDKIISGSRFYIHAKNIASALFFLIKNGKNGEKYNITSDKEISNLELAKLISKYIGKELKYEMIDYHSDRPGHDLRYGLDGSKIKELGWNLEFNFEESLKKTIEWTINNLEWLNKKEDF